MSDVDEAAERVERLIAGAELLEVYPNAKDKPPMRQGKWTLYDQQSQAASCYDGDLEELAMAFLAARESAREQAERDARPVTYDEVEKIFTNSRILISEKEGIVSADAGEIVLATSGDVRNLCSALGIKLDETA